MKINKIVIAEPSPIVAAGLLRFFEDMNQIQVVSVVDNIDDLNDKMIVHNPSPNKKLPINWLEQEK